MDVSMGKPTQRVRDFLIKAYERGAVSCGTAKNAELEGSTSVSWPRCAHCMMPFLCVRPIHFVFARPFAHRSSQREDSETLGTELL